MNKTTNGMSQDLNYKPTTVFEMIGKDVLTFLNNQVVSDLKNLDSMVFTAICNPQGRIIFTCFLHCNNDKALIAVDPSLSDNFLQYVNMRRFRMDVSIKKTTMCLQLDSIKNSLNLNEQLSFVDENDGCDLANFWQFIFKTGLPWITSKTTEQFIPQHVNLDQNNVIAFDKGCYPGQEIVARLHFLGKVKKRMTLVQYQSPAALPLNEIKSLTEFSQVSALCSPAIFDGIKWTCQVISKA